MLSKKRCLLPLSLLAAALLLISCGDDENPAGPGTSPSPSVLSIAATLFNSMDLSWTECQDGDFFEYRLYRSATPGIADNVSSATLVAGISSSSDTTYTDEGLDWTTTYYYALQTRDTEDLSAWSNEVFETTPDSGSGGTVLSCSEVQGQQASSPYEGQVVSVLGVVTVGGGEYYSSSFPYAVIADPEGGAWGGLVLFGDSAGTLSRGDSVIVTGEVDEYFGLTELTYITDVQMLGTGASLPSPVSMTTGDLATSADPEAYEAVLVTVSDAIVTEELTYGEYRIDDGTGECVFDDLGDYSWNPSVGDTVNTMTGVLWYSYDEFKIEPRDDADIDASGGGGGDVLTCYEVQGQQASSPYAGQTVSVTGVVTVAGDEYYSSSNALAVMADAGGGSWSGLALYGSSVYTLARGDSITITGEVQEYYGFTELSFPTSITVHSSGHALPDPEQLTTGELATSANPEEWESVLVSVVNVDVTSEPGTYGEWTVDDGSGDCIVDDLGDYTYSPQLGDTIVELVGVLWYSFDDFKIEPRDDADITR